ncbi:unnamed protein product [Orchesella dallaii]|uniref:C2H2-type domain-containing protein n=1 Tax=Orchesella dallaii TaxID=48710 RepID=A0ABP1S345_9HEXA
MRYVFLRRAKRTGSTIDRSTLYTEVEGVPQRNRNQPCTIDREIIEGFSEGVKVSNTELKEYAPVDAEERFLKYKKERRKASFQGQATGYGRAMESAGPGTGSRLEELLTVDKKTLKSWRESFGTASSSSRHDRTKISSETPVENPRKRLLMNALKDSLEKDVESEEKSVKGRKMSRWKTERKSDEAVTVTGAANAASGAHPLKVAPIILKKCYTSGIESAAECKELFFSLSEDESVEDSSVNELEISHKDVSNEETQSLKKNDFEREHMQAQIDKLLKMPSPPSKTWKRSSSSRQPKFQCKLCPKFFSVELELTDHMLTHSIKKGDADLKEKEPFEKKYACEFCEGKKFTWLTTLRAHYMNWHGELTQSEKRRLVDQAAARSTESTMPLIGLGFGSDCLDADVKSEKTSTPVNSKSSGTNKVRKVSKKSTPDSTKTARTSRQRNISEDLIKKVSKSISKEIGNPISNKSKKKSVQKIVVEASQSLNSGRASLRRNIQRPKWLTDTDLVTDYEFPRGTNTSRSGSTTSSPSTSQTTVSSHVVGAQTRASQATVKIPKTKPKLEKVDKKKSRASVVRNRVRTKSVDQVKVSSDSQATEQSPAITKDSTASCATIAVVEAVEKTENGNADVQDNPPDTPVPSNNDIAKGTDTIDEEVDTGISADETAQALEVLPRTREISNEIIESPKSCKLLEVEELTTQPVLDSFSVKTTDEEVFNGSSHSAPPEAPVLSKEMAFSNEPVDLPETMQVQDSEETQAPPVIDVFNSKSADDEISSSSTQSTALEAPVLSRETINGIPEVVEVPESEKVDEIKEELVSVEDIKIADDKSSVNGDQSESSPSPLSVTRKDSTVSSGIVEPPESLEPQVQDLEELPLEDDVTGSRRRDRSDSLSMRSCGSGSQSEKIKGLEDNKEEEEEEEECSTSKASEKDWAVDSDSDSNDSLMSEFSELAAQVSEKTDGVQFKEDCMRFLSTKISANSMWAIRKELKRLKKEKNYFKFGKLSPLAACLMHDLFCQSLK